MLTTLTMSTMRAAQTTPTRRRQRRSLASLGSLSVGSLSLALLAVMAAPAFAQTAEPGTRAAERDSAASGAAGDSAQPAEPGTEHHTGGPNEADEEDPDPTQHFNYLGIQPGHLFDYIGKDEYGGRFGDGKEVTRTGQTLREEEPASPPFVFMLLNFALLLGILAWKLAPLGHKVAEERHDLIKNALDEAARLRKQAADKLAEYETRLKDADVQIKQLVDGIRSDAKSEELRIRAAADTQAAQMKRDAELRIAAEIELARAQLTREVVAAATTVAEKLLREKLTAADQQKLVGAFITDVQSGSSAPRPGSPAGPTGSVTPGPR